MMRFVLPFLPVVLFILILVLINQTFPYLPPGLRVAILVFFLIAHAALQISSLRNWRRLK